MCEADSTTPAVEKKEQKRVAIGCPADVLMFLSNKLNYKSLTYAELGELSMSGDVAANTAYMLADFYDDVCVLAQEDSANPHGVGILSDSMPKFLSQVAEQLKLVGQLAFIGSNAAAVMTQRLEEHAAERKDRVARNG